jgi:hypothetical protein
MKMLILVVGIAMSMMASTASACAMMDAVNMMAKTTAPACTTKNTCSQYVVGSSGIGKK